MARTGETIDSMKHVISRLSDLILRSKPSPFEATAYVSKDGGLHDHRPLPSFETHRLRDAPQDEVRPGHRYDSNFKIAETSRGRSVDLGGPEVSVIH